MILTREEIEAREERELAPYAMRSAVSRGRVVDEKPDPHRTCFQRDRDRVVHSAAFRRLEYKTQVFVNDVGDHYRTRLTHSIEVSQVGRSVARTLGLNEDLVEVLALSHDLGHPPFGHSGEDELGELTEQQGGFEHNRQALRVVDLLERRNPRYPGLNLSYEVRESILKHPSSRAGGEDEFERRKHPLLEAQLTDIADSIAYNHHDLDDGLTAGLFSFDELEEVELVAEALREVADRRRDLEPRVLRTRVVKHVIDRMILSLIAESGRRIQEAGVGSADEARDASRRLIAFEESVRPSVGKLEKFLHRKFYRHYRVQRMRERSKRIIRELFTMYVRSPALLTPWYREWAETEGVERAVCDYVAGMTDRYAQEEFNKLFHATERL